MKINTKAPWYKSPEFSAVNAEVIANLGFCEACIHLKITESDGIAAVKCTQPDRIKQYRGISRENPCLHRVARLTPVAEPTWMWQCSNCGETYPPRHLSPKPHSQSTTIRCFDCGGKLEVLIEQGLLATSSK